MLLLTSTSDLVQVTTSAASDIQVHASYVDLSGATYAPGRTNTVISTATTTTVVGSPGAATQRNLKGLYITNNSTSVNCTVGVIHTDGTAIVELMQFILLPSENMTFNEEGRWNHRDAQGAEYPPAGRGMYDGKSIPFMKSSTAPDAIGYWYSTSKDAGFPGAWSPGTPGVNGRITDGTSAADFGCIRIPNPGVGANFLTEMQMGTSAVQGNLFADVLWVNSGLVATTLTAQAFTVPTLPPRDLNGQTGGEGCMIGLLCTTASGLAAVASNATITYTNSKGVAGRVATLSAVPGSQAPATPVIGTVVWFNMQAGDSGVGAGAWSLTLNTSWVSGNISIFIARDVAMIGTTQASVIVPRKLADPGVRLWNNTCLLHFVLASTAAVTFFNGELTITEK